VEFDNNIEKTNDPEKIKAELEKIMPKLWELKNKK
jgi:hypothetical protein